MKGTLVDLTQELFDGAPCFPGDPSCSISTHNSLEESGFGVSKISFSSHQGTHVDMPFHYFTSGDTLSELKLSRCLCRAVKVDLTFKQQCETIDLSDILPYETYIEQGCSLLFHTGWDKVFPKPKFFTDFPILSLELATWLAAREINLLGMDMPSPGTSNCKEIHEILLSANVLLVENLANLEQLPSVPFTFIGLPLRLKNLEASPIRALATLD